MMKHTYATLLLIAVTLGFTLTMPAPTIANTQNVVELKPVMIIRFNQDVVHFEQQLSMVVNRAQAIKPDVSYDLIQYIPVTESRSRLAQYGKHGNMVLDELTQIGVNPSQIRFMQTATPDVQTDEVYIFVR